MSQSLVSWWHPVSLSNMTFFFFSKKEEQPVHFLSCLNVSMVVDSIILGIIIIII